MQKANIKWDELGFSYQYVDNMYVSYWKDGKWDEGKIQDGDRISISIGATALHYGQECFEGLKAYSTKDGEIQLFRPDMNAKRLQDSCERLLMPEISVEKFIDACKQVVKANEKYVPPHGTGAAKVGGNYAGSMLPHKLANEEGYSDCIYLVRSSYSY